MHKEVILVTGACGRIGSSLVKRLGKHYKIVGFELLKALYASSSEELVPMDISSEESVHQAFEHILHFYGSRIKAVVHLAAHYSFSHTGYDKYQTITIEGTKRLLKALRKFHVEQFLFSSTMLVHAPTAPGIKITEHSPLLPKWAYPQSKVTTEKIIQEERRNIPSVILRIAGVYDDLCHSIPIANQIQRIYEKKWEAHLFAGNIHHGASFLHMEDLVEAICLTIHKKAALPEETVLLLGEKNTLSYAELQNQISSLLFGHPLKTFSIPKPLAKAGAWIQTQILRKKQFIQPWMIDFADDHYELDISKAEHLLSWKPRKNIKETLPLMVQALLQEPYKWYKTNGLSS